MTYFLQKWRDGPANGFRIGFGHGLFCVACCWAVMATAMAVGMMNLWWMAAQTALVFIEQVSARGEQFRLYLGIALVIAGAMQFRLRESERENAVEDDVVPAAPGARRLPRSSRSTAG